MTSSGNGKNGRRVVHITLSKITQIDQTVAIVDDDPILAARYAKILESKGYVVYPVCSGEEFLRLLETVTPQVTLLDANMPGMDGFQTIDNAKERGYATGFIILTANADDRSVYEKALERNVINIIENPCPPAELVFKTQRAFDYLRESYYARIDRLTGLANKRVFDEVLQRELSRARRTKTSVSVVMWDVDHFKDVNDTYGHVDGDRLLASIGQQVSKGIRDYDLFARVGGDEFALVLPNTTAELAVRVYERVTSPFREEPFEASNGDKKHITFSAGVATLSADMGSEEVLREVTPQDMIAAADSGLYEKKRDGRNGISSTNYLKHLLLDISMRKRG